MSGYSAHEGCLKRRLKFFFNQNGVLKCSVSPCNPNGLLFLLIKLECLPRRNSLSNWKWKTFSSKAYKHLSSGQPIIFFGGGGGGCNTVRWIEFVCWMSKQVNRIFVDLNSCEAKEFFPDNKFKQINAPLAKIKDYKQFPPEKES